eukprot:scaffold3757_cov17-Tisochrysis_lutea.AAC.1
MILTNIGKLEEPRSLPWPQITQRGPTAPPWDQFIFQEIKKDTNIDLLGTPLAESSLRKIAGIPSLTNYQLVLCQWDAKLGETFAGSTQKTVRLFRPQLTPSGILQCFMCTAAPHVPDSRFLKLPPWVKIILTGRPQVQSEFSAWQPFCIEPNQERNKPENPVHYLILKLSSKRLVLPLSWHIVRAIDSLLQSGSQVQIDLLVLLETRLKEGDHVARRDIFGAADVLLRKSEGQFIYSKYAFDELRKRPPRAWSLSDMESQLPSGLVGVFQHVLGILTDALEAERMDLLRLMEQKVLPIL